jgi:hypothetical protein
MESPMSRWKPIHAFACRSIFWASIALVINALLLSVSVKAQSANSAARLRIEVTGGEKDLPVENASVYVKYVEERKIRKDKKFEMNVKTNREGVAHVPDAPVGKVLVQVIADGWKTYGRWYEITDTKEPIKIHLDRPPKWY